MRKLCGGAAAEDQWGICNATVPQRPAVIRRGLGGCGGRGSLMTWGGRDRGHNLWERGGAVGHLLRLPREMRLACVVGKVNTTSNERWL